MSPEINWKQQLHQTSHGTVLDKYHELLLSSSWISWKTIHLVWKQLGGSAVIIWHLGSFYWILINPSQASKKPNHWIFHLFGIREILPGKIMKMRQDIQPSMRKILVSFLFFFPSYALSLVPGSTYWTFSTHWTPISKGNWTNCYTSPFFVQFKPSIVHNISVEWSSQETAWVGWLSPKLQRERERERRVNSSSDLIRQ